MNKLATFIPLAKADAAQRLVYGYFDETPDRSREIFDYASSKPSFIEWSDSFAKATDGRSVGNIRAQHGKIAAGKLEKIAFDDDAKRIEFCAHIVDDNEWKKVEAGVYTGFSPGGRYAKRWADPERTGHTRYTAQIAELSIVDVPCNPSATFTMVKADGVEEEIEFVLDKAYEPGNDATKDRADVMAKAAEGTSWKDHVVQARADLIAENAADALAKMADETDASEQHAENTVTDASLNALDAALAKADTVLVVDKAGKVTAVGAYAAALAGTMLKCDVDLAVAPPSPEAVALIGADLANSIDAVAAIRAAAVPVLAKGLYDLGDVVESLRSFAWITSSVTDEACWEQDGSPLPQMAVDILKALKAFLIAMVEEEVSEMLTRLQREAGEDVVLVIEGESMELAVQIIDLVKADVARMEKAGARNAKADATRIQAIHDKAGELGATCADSGAEKAAALGEANDRLTKAIDRAAPAIERLTKQVETLEEARAADLAVMEKMRTELDRIGGLPAKTKIQQVIDKENDGLEKSGDKAASHTIESARDLTGADRQAALEMIAFNAKHRINTPEIPA